MFLKRFLEFISSFSILIGIIRTPCVLTQSTDELVFLVLGDWGDAFYWDVDSPQMRVSAAMNAWAANHTASFILTTGDNFYPDGVRSPNDAWFEQKWRRVYSGEHIRDLQWRISLGNHDYNPTKDRPSDNAGGNEMFQLARSEQDPQWHLPWLWYKFSEDSPAGQVDFFVVDTEAIDEQFNNYTEQYEWLERELSSSQAAVKLVIGHHPVYTVGNYAPGTETLWPVLEELMLEYEVNMYICGHDHSMSHLWFTNGTSHEYVVIAGGGREVNPENEFWSNRLRENRGLESTYYSEHGFGAVAISQTEIKIDMINQEGNILFTINQSLQ